MEQTDIVVLLDRLAQLRTVALPAAASSGVPVVPDIYFSWDTQNGTVSAELDRAEGGLLRTRLDITGRPAWLTLNIELGRLRFREGGSFGMLIETGPQNAGDGHPIGMFPFIRSSDARGRLSGHGAARRPAIGQGARDLVSDPLGSQP